MSDRIHTTRTGVYHASAGGIVVCANGEPPVMALLRWKEKNGWTYPKGHIKTRETAREAARREVCEELGITRCPLPTKKMGVEHSVFTLPNDERTHRKQTHLYLFLLDKKRRLAPNKTEHFIDARWVTLKQVERMMKPSPFVTSRCLQIGNRMVKKNINQCMLAEVKNILKKRNQKNV